MVGGEKPVVIRFDGSKGMRSGITEVVEVPLNWPKNQGRTPLQRGDSSQMHVQEKPVSQKEASPLKAAGPTMNVSVNK